MLFTRAPCAPSTSYAAPPGADAPRCRAPRSTRAVPRFVAAATSAPFAPPAAPAAALAERARADFPILHQEVHGRPLVYLDSAATSQKPAAVIDALSHYYRADNSNVHRGVHALAARATAAYEGARAKVARFINAASPEEVVFTRNATEAINLVANTWGLATLRPGDEVLLSVAEHHSNLVPWQLVAAKTGAVLRFVPLTPDTEELDVVALKAMLSSKTKLVSLVHVSNALGCVLPAAEVGAAARAAGARLLLDCCQSVPNMPVDVSTLGADWIVASGHKMCGPSGVGFLWGSAEVLSSMPPWMGGGEMIADVFLDHSTYAEPPSRFEAGTPAIGEAIALGAAVDYLSEIGMDKIHAYERELGAYLYGRLAAVPRVRIYGPPPNAKMGRAALATFNVEGVHPTDLSTLLDAGGIAVRSGHLCTQPLHRALGAASSLRASPYFYNTPGEVDAFIEGLAEAIAFFS